MTTKEFRKAAVSAFMAAATMAGAASTQAAVFVASGDSPASIQTTVDDFRAALGANNGVGGTFASGRREINWDGVANGFAAPNQLPGNFFNTSSARGVVVTTAGSGVAVSSNFASGVSPLFGNLDLLQSLQFQTFSAERLFTALNSTTVDVQFFIPGTGTPTFVSGFGAVFTDVELAGGTLFTVTLGDGSSGGQFAVPVGGNHSLSFLGLTDPRGYRSIRIQSGTGAVGTTENLANNRDVVAMDDFIYGEPNNPSLSAVPVPVPAPVALLGLGVLGFGWRARRR